MPVTVNLEHLSGGYSVSRLPVDQPLPEWVTGPGLVNVTYAADEISVVCRTDRVPEQVETASGWSAIKVSTKFGFDEAGVVLSVVNPISSAGLGVFVISTFYRDYLLVRTAELAKVVQLLQSAGHQFQPFEEKQSDQPPRRHGRRNCVSCSGLARHLRRHCAARSDQAKRDRS